MQVSRPESGITKILETQPVLMMIIRDENCWENDSPMEILDIWRSFQFMNLCQMATQLELVFAEDSS